MKNKLNNYTKEVEKQISNKKNWTKEEIKEYLIQIQFFEHERLIHLLVTIFVGLSTVLFFLFAIALENLGILVIFFCFLLLLIPYIIHYYHLENGVQKLIEQYNQIQKNRP